ncbi:Zn-ribbon domain-containing OB-fold protein [Bordetella genomosp. 4]|uniref:Zn-ribbon domain-containing OB-fold protein n=1 Tax=Bordetella genomosp. 4 TaxID=463044 RepID=UPI000B9E7D32|nr:OB-fold domain-containing protein [Bordetella genomosp. 4]OZI43224.1 hypothetical protein CAL21_20790 [Bordetella genomosp. 4]
MSDNTDAQRSIAATLRQPESAPFQTAAAEGRFVIPRCQHCKQAHWYPRALCPFCFSSDIQWEQASGRGSIYTYTVMRRAKPAYAVGYVQLEEGPILMTNITGGSFDDLRIGMPVVASFEPAANGTLVPMFSPAPAA